MKSKATIYCIIYSIVYIIYYILTAPNHALEPKRTGFRVLGGMVTAARLQHLADQLQPNRSPHCSMERSLWEATKFGKSMIAATLPTLTRTPPKVARGPQGTCGRGLKLISLGIIM